MSRAMSLRSSGLAERRARASDEMPKPSMISDRSAAVMLMPTVAGVAFVVGRAAGTEAGRVGVRRVLRVCAWDVNESAAARVVKTMVLKNKWLRFFLVCPKVLPLKSDANDGEKRNDPNHCARSTALVLESDVAALPCRLSAGQRQRRHPDPTWGLLGWWLRTQVSRRILSIRP